MGKAIATFILSASIGTCFAFFSPAIGVVMSISTVGAFLVYQKK